MRGERGPLGEAIEQVQSAWAELLRATLEPIRPYLEPIARLAPREVWLVMMWALILFAWLGPILVPEWRAK